MKRVRNDGSVSPHLKGRVLIDGNPPRNPKPELIPKRSKSQFVTGRQRLADLKGLLTEIIEDIYPPLTCPVCFENHSTRAEADSHAKEKHHGEKPFECLAECEQAYSSRNGLRYHLFNIHSVQPVAGEALTKPDSTSSKKTKTSHRILEKDLAKTSTNASSKASTKTSAKRLPKKSASGINEDDSPPNSTKSKESPVDSDKAFQEKVNEVYPVTVCPSCKESFTKKTHVIRHLVQVHKGEEPYECFVPTCKRAKCYATREGLIYHLVNYHN
ncbi:hypothetical protein BY458DRAFT_86172 [Sporodiniella umbellata]|nr:hypothetical protein BY458DRAFT_86172 [Sporodiniella umbellata]